MTILEVSLVATLATVVLMKVAVVMQAANDQLGSQATQLDVEERARIVLDKIAYQLMGAERDTLLPLNTPNVMHVTGVQYSISLGVEDGEIVYSEPESIQFVENGEEDEVTYARELGTASERQVVWTRLVQPYLEGELPNGVDDNGNGLVDEEGLFFHIERDHIEIGLTLARLDDAGRRAEFTTSRFITIRN